MSTTLWILSALAPIGALDVLYYHLYRFRLFARRASLAEELTHLLRHLCFLALVALLAQGSPSPWADRAILGILALDLLNSALDVALEPRSRATLGGLPPGEYLLHFLGTFGTGLATATYLTERHTPFPAAPAWQIAPMLLAGASIFLLEFSLFIRAHLVNRHPN